MLPVNEEIQNSECEMGAAEGGQTESVMRGWQRKLLRRIALVFLLILLVVVGGLSITSNAFVELYLFETLLVLLLFMGAVGLLVWQSVREIAIEPLQRELEQRLGEQKEEAPNLDSQGRDEFMATMSHELRTPLTVLLGNSEMLAKSRLTESQQDLLRTIDISGRSLLYMLNDILDLSKVESEGFSLEWCPFDMQALIKEMGEIFPRRSTDDGITFKTELKGNFDHQLIGDMARIRQIMLNLCGNAVKFTDQGEVRLQVEMMNEGPLGEGSWVRIVVEDEGVGMSPEVIEKLFEPFQQADSAISRRHGGTGLGLHISWKLIQRMGGMVDVQSEEGRGSRFQVCLPLQLGAPVTQQSASEATYFRGRVLVAEDTSEVQLLLRQILEGYGIEVDMVENGQQALERGLSESFDLILMDMQMPVMDGIEATTLLRQSFCQAPIVALTANVMQVHRNKFNQAGCNEFLTKPVEQQKLQGVLAAYLETMTQEEAEALQLTERSQELTVSDELKQLFLEGTAQRQQEIREALAQEAWEALRLAAHNIKGSAANFGFPGLTEQARMVCDHIDQLSSSEEIRSAAETLDQEISVALQ